MEYKIVIVGDKRTGKTSLVKRLASDKFQSRYSPTTQCEITTINYTTTRGDVTFHVYDGGYPDRPDAAIMMFDLTNEGSLSSMTAYESWLNVMFGRLPAVICGNKHDLINKIIEIPNLIFDNNLRNASHSYFCINISVKNSTDVGSPLLYLLRQLLTPDWKIFSDIANSDITFLNNSETTNLP